MTEIFYGLVSREESGAKFEWSQRKVPKEDSSGQSLALHWEAVNWV